MRFWLGLSASAQLPTAASMGITFNAYVAEMALQFQDAMHGNQALLGEGAYTAQDADAVAAAEAALAGMVGGRESVVFLAPMGAHNAIADEDVCRT